MQGMWQMQTLFDDGDKHISAYRYPDLRFHRVLGGAQKRLDAQMLFDPFEEQLYLPALPVKGRYQLGFESEVVGQESHALAHVVLGHNPAQDGRVVLARVVNRQHARLVANHRRADAIHWTRIAPLELGIALGARDEEGLCFVEGMQTSEIQITPVQQVIC